MTTPIVSPSRPVIGRPFNDHQCSAPSSRTLPAAAGQTPTLAGPQTGAWRRTWALTANRKKPATTKRWPEL